MMITEPKPYKINKLFNFDERLLEEFSKESSIAIVEPLGTFNLAIKLQQDQEPCVHGIGYPARICRYILKDYMQEDYDIFLTTLFEKLKRYGTFINVEFSRFTKLSMNITLASGYKSITDISSFGFKYDISTRDWKYDTVETDVIIVFEGESFYDLNIIDKKLTTMKMIINYNDLNGFFLKFVTTYRNKFAKKLGVQRSTEIEKMLLLTDMLLF